MEALEDILRKERNGQAQSGSNSQNDQDQTQEQDIRNVPDHQSASSPGQHTATGTSDAEALSLSVDAATAMIDLQRANSASMSTSHRPSTSEIQPPPYRYDPMPIDDLVRLPTPASPGLASSNNNNTTNTTHITATASDTANVNECSNTNDTVSHGNYSNDANGKSNDTNNFNPEHQIIFDMGPYHCTDNSIQPSTIEFGPPVTGTVHHIDRMNTATHLENQCALQQSADLHEQPIRAVDNSQSREMMTPSSGDIENATETDESRFYGPTSQPYLHSTHEESPLSTTNDLGDDSTLDIDLMQVRRLLFENYWAIHALAAKVIINKKRFMADRVIGKRSQYYSTFLENALLAIATRTSTSRAMRELGKQFLERARAEVSFELEHLNVASMQGFLLLSDYEATRGRDRLGWMYCGIACRSLYDLGLHDNTKVSSLSSVDIVGRHSVFLTSFVYDQLWSLYLGRPSSISLGFVRTARLAAKNVTVPDELDAWVSLCVMIAKVTKALNSSPWADVYAYDRRLSELASELDTCFEHLPTRLRYEEGSAFDLEACAYGLNIQHFGLRIVLHRNSIRLREERRSEFEGIQAQQSAQHENSQRLSKSARIVHQSAVRVAKLIRTYKQLYGVEKIITIMLDNMFVASTALILHILSSSPHNPTISEKDVQWLRSLSETLEEVQKFYPITTVMISTLSQLVKDTALGGTFRTGRTGSVTSKESPSGGLQAMSMPPLSMAGWGSREAFMNGFTFDMGSVMDNNFNLNEDHTQYFHNPVVGASPSWSLGFSR
ncbi:hypothetical protein IQ07DRAFT_649271 [Pyrenochaeta sp. DS3sAY3a]|nr:hypothetical protein IQ07DRAFT_649271 [Pyrenochaeta sp. DS3sAY3a]